MINRYLEELWLRDKRHEVALVKEGARSVKEEYGELRYSDPFTYSLLGSTATYRGYYSEIRDINFGTRMLVADRGHVDRRVFRRTFFHQGDVRPGIMEDENGFEYSMENTPIQIGGVIMLMTSPEETMKRSDKPGPVANMDFLPRLSEQYWRLYHELMEGDVTTRTFTCIDAEKDQEEVYERFKYALDTSLNMHRIYLYSLASAFPREYDLAMAHADELNRPRREWQAAIDKIFGGRTLIVGGDEMESVDEILEKPIVEGIDLRRMPGFKI